MKKLTAGLKGANIADFFIRHGEKLAMGLVVLIVLGVLGTSQWSRYPKTPQEIQKLVRDARTNIQTSVWPEDKRATFALQDFAGKALEVRGPLNFSPFEYSTNMWWPLYRKQELAKDPELLAVMNLEAKAGVFSLGIAPAPAANSLVADGGAEGTSAGPAGAPGAPTKPDGFDDQFSPVRPSAGAAGAAGGMMAGGAAMPAAPAMPTGAPQGYVPPGFPGAGGAAEVMVGGEGMMGSGAGAMVSNMESRGERFIAVRGVWPIWQQMEKLQRALNLQTTNDARSYLQLLDFTLERQTAVAGPDPWSGPWEVVDIQRALDVLNEAYDYDIDRLDPQIIDPVITMPLPARLVGVWGDYATHPKIEKFTLPPAELERETKLQEKLIEQFEKYRLEEEKKVRKQGGFAGRQRNIGAMANQMYNSEYAPAFEQTMQTYMAEDPTMRMRLPDLKSRLTAVGRLLLFRYFDFDVRPGLAYRYRVKLKLSNPNYERPLDQVLEPSVAEGEERETPWSNESNVAVVPESVNYFLQDVERDPVNESRPTASRPLAKIDFFEWDTSVGTMIRDTVEVKAYGQFLEETKKSLKLDVAKPTFKDSDVTFRSDDLFVDATTDRKIDPAQHPDLQLPPAQRGKIGMAPEAAIVEISGELRTLDPTTQARKHKELEVYVQRERAPFESIKNAEAKPAEFMGMDGGAMMPAGPYGAEMMMGMDSSGMMPGAKKKKKRNPRKPAEMTSGMSGMPVP